MNCQLWAQTSTTNSIQLTNYFNRAKASQGDVLTYTLVLSNNGSATTTDVLVRDSLSTGLRYVANSLTVPNGTTFSTSTSISTWLVPSLSAGQSFSLTYQAVADSTGILYSKATVPGDTSAACISIPVRVCTGDTYLFQLAGPAGPNSYRWFRDGIELTDQRARLLDVTTPGSYSLVIDGVSGKCPDFSCCPFIIEEYAVPTFQASTVPASCSGIDQANGQIILTGFNPTDTYQFAEGTAFNPAASLSGESKTIPPDGIIANTLANPTGSKSYTIRVYNASGCYSEETVTLLPAACLSLTTTANPGDCQNQTNSYLITGILSLTNAHAGTATITDGLVTTSIPVSAGATSVPYSLTGLPSGSGLHSVHVDFAGQTSSTTYTAPDSCSPAAPVTLDLEQLVDKSKAKIGELVSYTVVLTNTGTTSATTVEVQISRPAGLHYVISSIVPPPGTTVNPSIPISIWTVASLSGGQSLSLTFQAIADSSGILYNKASIPGDTATVCTSVPAKVCVGDDYTFRITALAGRSAYQWFRTFQGVTTELTSFTTNVLDVTQPGEYKLAIDNQVGKCPDFSCCPFIVEEDSLPTFQAKALPVSCVGNTPQTNGQLILSGFQPGNTYQYSLGTSFDRAASLSGIAKVIPISGVLVNSLVNPVVAQAYTVRVFNASGCYTDVTVLLIPTVCDCPADICVPFVISQSKRARRIGDPRY